jgi:hypothetical protein
MHFENGGGISVQPGVTSGRQTGDSRPYDNEVRFHWGIFTQISAIFGNPALPFAEYSPIFLEKICQLPGTDPGESERAKSTAASRQSNLILRHIDLLPDDLPCFVMDTVREMVIVDPGDQPITGYHDRVDAM